MYTEALFTALGGEVATIPHGSKGLLAKKADAAPNWVAIQPNILLSLNMICTLYKEYNRDFEVISFSLSGL